MGAGNLRQRHRRQRAAQVLDAAEALFARHGYEGTRIEEIAETASVAPATIYNYFATKPNLLMELALRHVHAVLPERRAFLKSLPDEPLKGIEAFERLLAEQALRFLSRECWRIIMSAQFLEPQGRASRTGARLNNLIKQHYIRMIRTYQARERLDPACDPVALSELIVGITTMNFSRFIAGSNGDLEDLLAMGVPHIRLILAGLLCAPEA
ncbi:MAG: helix-turn-helix transcriptional regulator [Rhizobiales bacterium]|nr:helix-turn-helix transcriptional regulator [Hyphomicrobiales bacterium]MBN9073473.1 helix-turn-helix transcriptional regulator [Hyphomicrobiales bacterium]